jgi:hypothetical protein
MTPTLRPLPPQAAESVTKDTVVFKLTEDSPRAQALQQQEAAVARLNQQICEQVTHSNDLNLLVTLLQQHAAQLNFVSIIAITVKAAELVADGSQAASVAGLTPLGATAGRLEENIKSSTISSDHDAGTDGNQQQPQQKRSKVDVSQQQQQQEQENAVVPAATEHHHKQQQQSLVPVQSEQHSHQQQQKQQPPLSLRAHEHQQQSQHRPQQQQQASELINLLLTLLPPLILQHAAAFQATHFVQAAASLTSLHFTPTSFWQPFCTACDRKLGALTISQLTTLLTSLATVGFTPSLNWVEKSYRQAKKHMHRSQPEDLAGILWAWGVMGYTPRDAPLLTMMKDRALRKMKQGGFSGQQLVQLMFGLARMPKYAPNKRWLLVYAKALEPHLRRIPPGKTSADKWAT